MCIVRAVTSCDSVDIHRASFDESMHCASRFSRICSALSVSVWAKCDEEVALSCCDGGFSPFLGLIVISARGSISIVHGVSVVPSSSMSSESTSASVLCVTVVI